MLYKNLNGYSPGTAGTNLKMIYNIKETNDRSDNTNIWTSYTSKENKG